MTRCVVVAVAMMALITGQVQRAEAANVSSDIEAGNTTIDGTDTWALDNTNEGDTDHNLSFSGASARLLTITPDGGDGDDTGQVGTITLADDLATSGILIAEATDSSAHTFCYSWRHSW